MKSYFNTMQANVNNSEYQVKNSLKIKISLKFASKELTDIIEI